MVMVVVHVVEVTQVVYSSLFVKAQTDLSLAELHLTTSAIPTKSLDVIKPVLREVTDKISEVVSLVFPLFLIKQSLELFDISNPSVGFFRGWEVPLLCFLNCPIFRSGQYW